MKQDEIQIAIILDDNYIIPSLITVYSLAVNNKDKPITLHVLKTGEKKVHKLFKSLQSERFTVNLINLEAESEDFIFDKYFHVTPTALIKFRLASIFPNLSKLLYLDSDLLVLGNIGELWDYDLEGSYGAFVKDLKPLVKYSRNRLETLGIKHHNAYFNSGVMLLNLDLIRKDDAERRLFEYRKYGLNNFMDQDAINVVLGEKAISLNLKYNFLVTLLQEFSLEEINKGYGLSLTEKELSQEQVFEIIHYSSRDKPWNSPNPKYADLWKDYLARFFAEYAQELIGLDNNYSHLNNIIVSLTSYGDRIKSVYQVIKTLKEQSLKARKIILWLAEEETDGDIASLPKELVELIDGSFEIRFCKDLKSYKKLLPTLKLFPGNLVVTADDDQLYNRHWLLELFLSWLEYPEAIHCHRGHRLVFNSGQLENYVHWIYDYKQNEPSCLLFPTGCGGILYPPNCFMREIFREEIFMNKCRTGDDIWFWAMSIMKNRLFRVAPCSSYVPNEIPLVQDLSLYEINKGVNGNDKMLKTILFYYPFIKRIILNEHYKLSQIN